MKEKHVIIKFKFIIKYFNSICDYILSCKTIYINLLINGLVN